MPGLGALLDARNSPSEPLIRLTQTATQTQTQTRTWAWERRDDVLLSQTAAWHRRRRRRRHLPIDLYANALRHLQPRGCSHAPNHCTRSLTTPVAVLPTKSNLQDTRDSGRPSPCSRLPPAAAHLAPCTLHLPFPSLPSHSQPRPATRPWPTNAVDSDRLCSGWSQRCQALHYGTSTVIPNVNMWGPL